MYRAQLNNRDKGGAIVAVVAVHALLLLALLQLSGRIDLADPQSALQVFDLRDQPPSPPPPQPKPVQQVQKAQPKRSTPAGGSPPKPAAQATPVVAPKSKIVLPTAPTIPVSPSPQQGSATTQGNAQAGNGTGGNGAGGNGNGTGTGSGDGAGAGDGDVAAPATIIRGISGRDYPPAVQRSWPRGGVIFLRLRIEANGRPSRCDVMRSFGNPSTDQWTCALIMQRGVFRPATNARGVPVSSWYGYKQVDVSR